MSINLENVEVAEIEVSYSHKIESNKRIKITCSYDAHDVLKSIWKYPMDHRESAYALYLDRGNTVLGYFLVSLGGVTGTVIDVKLVIQTALKVNASAIILAHNHPSGNQQPSQADLSITKKVKEACNLIEMNLLDHLIIYSDGYTSFGDKGLLD